MSAHNQDKELYKVALWNYQEDQNTLELIHSYLKETKQLLVVFSEKADDAIFIVARDNIEKWEPQANLIKNALNKSIEAKSNNSELVKEIEIHTLKAKVDKYERALKEILLSSGQKGCLYGLIMSSELLGLTAKKALSDAEKLNQGEK